VVYPIESFDYGMREFAIRDNNGYILQFGAYQGAGFSRAAIQLLENPL